MNLKACENMLILGNKLSVKNDLYKVISGKELQSLCSTDRFQGLGFLVARNLEQEVEKTN